MREGNYKGGKPKWFYRPRDTGLARTVLLDSGRDQGHYDVDPHMGDRLYTDEEAEFLKAVDARRRQRGRRFLTACDYLQVLKDLGYRKAT